MISEIEAIKTNYDGFILGFCKCGCKKQIDNLRTSKGLLHLYVYGHNRKGKKHPNFIPKVGPDHGMWRGGRIMNSK